MVVGILLIVLLQWIFLGDLRQRTDRRRHDSVRVIFCRDHSGAAWRIRNLLSVGAIDFDWSWMHRDHGGSDFSAIVSTTALSEAEQSHISTDTAMGQKSHAILSASADVSRSIFFGSRHYPSRRSCRCSR